MHSTYRARLAAILARCCTLIAVAGFAVTPDGEPGLHYLCAGYKKFFRHIRKYLRAMATLIENDLPVSLVMDATKGPLVVTQGSRTQSGPPSATNPTTT